MFKTISCNEGGDSILVAFRDEKRGRYITFMGDYQEFAIRRGREMEKGLLGWDGVSAIELKKTKGSSGGFMSLRLKPEQQWFGNKIIEFGEVDEDCWDKLKARFGSRLRFVELPD